MGCILTRLNGLECPTDTPSDVRCFLTLLRVGMNISMMDWSACLTDIPRDVGCFLIPLRVGMNISITHTPTLPLNSLCTLCTFGHTTTKIYPMALP